MIGKNLEKQFQQGPAFKTYDKIIVLDKRDYIFISFCVMLINGGGVIPNFSPLLGQVYSNITLKAVMQLFKHFIQ